MGLSGSRLVWLLWHDAGHFGTGNVKLQHDYNNIFLVGFRYNFGQAPPPGTGAGRRAGSGGAARPLLPGVLRLG